MTGLNYQNSVNSVSIHSPAIALAGKEALSLALIDARNHSLSVMAKFENARPTLDFTPDASVQTMAAMPPPMWLFGHMGWFQEWWISRNCEHAVGDKCSQNPIRIDSIEPAADSWFNPAQVPIQTRWVNNSLKIEDIKIYLLDTLETTLELMDKTPNTDDALYFFRLVLAFEDMAGERLAVLAQSLGVALNLTMPASRVAREPLLIPATRYALGTPRSGFAWDNEIARQSHADSYIVQVPEFEIDAQAVSWAQYVEFVDDGGYDDEQIWSPHGWQWLQGLAEQEGRRGPRFVEQIGVASGAVMQTRFGQSLRQAGAQTAMHLSWYEADAYARWAGRRLATEVEWEVAAVKARGRGFVVGDAWEWTASSFRPYPGFVPGPWQRYSVANFGRCKVLRGGSFATRLRMVYPQFRGFALPSNDAGFFGFRTCAL